MIHDDGLTWVLICLLILAMMAVIFVTAILFCCSIRKTMSHVPEEKRQFPHWFIWMTLIPMVNFIFAWIIFPFGIPHELKNTVGDNVDALRDVNTLRQLGWSLQILATINFILSVFFRYLNVQQWDASTITVAVSGLLLVMLASLLWAVYWVKIVNFRKRYFNHL